MQLTAYLPIIGGLALILVVTGTIVWFTARAMLRSKVPVAPVVLVETLCLTFLTIWYGARTFTPGAWILLAFIQIILAIGITIIVIAKYGESGKKVRKNIWAIGIFFVVFCGDVVVGNIIFQSLCAYEGGTTIVRTVDNVAGFVDQDGAVGCGLICMGQLGKSHYRFIEQEVRHGNPDFLAPTPGKYRFYLSQRGAPECALYEQFLSKWTPSYAESIEPRYGIPVASCVATIRIPEFEATYIYNNIESAITFGLFRIFREERMVADRITGEILGKTVFFRATGGWIAWLLDSQSNGQSCYGRNRFELLAEILKPVK